MHISFKSQETQAFDDILENSSEDDAVPDVTPMLKSKVLESRPKFSLQDKKWIEVNSKFLNKICIFLVLICFCFR